jgi:hypothetical protein
MMRFAATIVACSAALAGCGYAAGYRAPEGVRTVAVPIFQNATFPLRREVEYDITEALRREIQARTSLQLAEDGAADLTVYGKVREFRESVIAEDRQDRKIESNLIVAVSLVVEDYANARRSETEVRVREPFSPELGETIDAVRRRAMKNLSERILLVMESWD